VALGLVPVTVCTDLLQPGGYGRPFGYFDELRKRMDVVGASSVDEFVVSAYGAGGPTDLAAAKIRNTDLYVERATADPRYAATAHRKVPRKIGRQLKLFDCLTCDKCIPVCPNDANFTFRMASTPEVPVTEERQIGNFADFCNDCGNCDTFCPEDGGPFKLKPRFFISRERWLADAPRDAILVERDAITGRFDGVEVRVTKSAAPTDDANVRILRRLRDALLAPTEVNYVNLSLVR
jgi:putative selenate reductase